MELKTIEQADHPVFAAGRLWIIPSVLLTELPDGAVGISMAELRRVHKAIANAICATASAMTPDELEFLCDITDTTFAAVAGQARLDKSTVSKWRRRGHLLPWVLSLHFKKWFWFKLFGDELAASKISLQDLASERELLPLVGRLAIQRNLTTAVKERRADAA